MQAIQCHVFKRKEIENYALSPDVLMRAIRKRQQDRTPPKEHLTDRQIRRLIDAVSDQFRHDTAAHIGASRVKFFQETKSKLDSSTVWKDATVAVEKDWKDINKRLSMLGGKDFISQLSARLQKRKGFSLTINMLIDEMRPDEIAPDLTLIISQLNTFCSRGSAA